MSSPTTVRPKLFEEDFEVSSTEEGLSIDPDELGRHFLRYATEQGDVEFSSDGGASEPPFLPDTEEGSFEDDPDYESDKPRDLDLLRADIHDASLFDEEGEEGDEVESPDVDADEAELDAKVAQRSSTL